MDGCVSMFHFLVLLAVSSAFAIQINKILIYTPIMIHTYVKHTIYGHITIMYNLDHQPKM